MVLLELHFLSKTQENESFLPKVWGMFLFTAVTTAILCIFGKQNIFIWTWKADIVYCIVFKSLQNIYNIHTKMP